MCATGLSWVVGSLLGWWKLGELVDGKEDDQVILEEKTRMEHGIG